MKKAAGVRPTALKANVAPLRGRNYEVTIPMIFAVRHCEQIWRLRRYRPGKSAESESSRTYTTIARAILHNGKRGERQSPAATGVCPWGRTAWSRSTLITNLAAPGSRHGALGVRSTATISPTGSRRRAARTSCSDCNPALIRPGCGSRSSRRSSTYARHIGLM